MDGLAIVGGHLALDLVNTVAPRVPGEPPDTDWLGGPADLLTWARERSVVDETSAEEIRTAWRSGGGPLALAAATTIREAVYTIMLAELGEPYDAAPGLELLTQCWAAAASRSTLTLGPTGPDQDRLLIGTDKALMIPDRLAVAAVDLVRNHDPGKLKACPLQHGGCGWLFIDTSRNHARRWCSMADCGTKAKSQRLTDRRRRSRTLTRQIRQT